MLHNYNQRKFCNGLYLLVSASKSLNLSNTDRTALRLPRKLKAISSGPSTNTSCFWGMGALTAASSAVWGNFCYEDRNLTVHKS